MKPGTYSFVVILLSLACSLTLPLKAEEGVVPPSDQYKPEEVVTIQLVALKNNDSPFPGAGIRQTFAFARPDNKAVTGPVERFANMIHTPAYSPLLNHLNHEVKRYSSDGDSVLMLVKVTTKSGDRYGFQWVVRKYNGSECQNCWLTSMVSNAVKLKDDA